MGELTLSKAAQDSLLTVKVPLGSGVEAAASGLALQGIMGTLAAL